jgi:hypothetical protein
MRVSAIHQIQPIPPLLPILPPSKKEEPEKPLSFCGRLNRLLEIHRRHLVFDRMMNFWTHLMEPSVKTGSKLNFLA